MDPQKLVGREFGVDTEECEKPCCQKPDTVMLPTGPSSDSPSRNILAYSSKTGWLAGLRLSAGQTKAEGAKTCMLQVEFGGKHDEQRDARLEAKKLHWHAMLQGNVTLRG